MNVIFLFLIIKLMYIVSNMNKSIEEQNKLIISILKKNKDLMDMLDFVYKLNLPNFYIAAGAIFQTIWNYYDNKPLNNGIKDLDIIYYNKSDLSVDTDIKYFNQIKKYSNSKNYDYEIDVSNEARMHIWKKEKLGIDTEQYTSSEDAINRWIATVHAIGITKDENGIKIYAPYGLNDIFTRTIRPIKHNDNRKELYNKKVVSWKKRFKNINVIKW